MWEKLKIANNAWSDDDSRRMTLTAFASYAVALAMLSLGLQSVIEQLFKAISGLAAELSFHVALAVLAAIFYSLVAWFVPLNNPATRKHAVLGGAAFLIVLPGVLIGMQTIEYYIKWPASLFAQIAFVAAFTVLSLLALSILRQDDSRLGRS